ncbi:glycosyltransferase [Pseudomonas sp. 14P_8.1_Bac3]|uniref:glycosyltransferase n=1 Tax=Pseudomonas sp. 14P_8.1_Bac3 TaxID=2971621 RepID=UPI0021C90B81|nr:glycosyltransferase [Pseudomonas sp. 14P_8.1_Bac3]MCU1759164.1 glycosyltransferase [Pseudomonas sp. 14P_8.1_Bac3]
MVRSLFARRPSPYYIIAPDYRRNSAGVRVLHMLCDALIRSGFEAYVSAGVVDPRLMTPRLTGDVRALHKSQGVEPVVVYPEVMDGNPLGGNVVVRYLLNHPGLLREVSPFGKDDILFSYTRTLLQPGMSEDRILYMPAVDLSIFCPPTDPATRIAGKVCYYQGRHAQALVDPALLAADSVEITQQSPGSWEDLAALFQSCEFFYCTEPSGLAAEAVLCGCVAIILPNKYATAPLSQHENNGYGCAWGNTPENIEQARETLPLMRQSLLKNQSAFWSALDHFIEVTQAAVEQYQGRNLKSEVAQWLDSRVLTDVQQTLINQHLRGRDVPAIGVVVLDQQGTLEGLNDTLESLAQCSGLQVAFHPRVLTTADGVIDNQSIYKLDETDPVATINQVVNTSGCDLFVIVRAGQTFTVAGLLSIVLDLAAGHASRAIYADEVMRFDDGNLDLLLRPDINLDLLLSFPASMARHWLFRREVWLEMGGFDTRYQDAFELEFILRLIETNGLEGLRHISEPLVIADALMLQDNPQQREVIERHLQARGFAAPHIASRLPGQYELDYGHATSPSVSILIVVDGQLAHAQRCVESLLENTSYTNFELLLLDRGNADPLVTQWLAGIDQMGVGHLRVLRFPAELSPEMIRNQAAGESRGEFLLFLDAGTGILAADWLQQLLNHAMRPEVGCVGAKLIDAQGNVRQAGWLLGLGAAVANPYEGIRADAAGYMQRLQVDQNCSAVSGQCLMLRQALFAEVAGFDEQLQPWADADLCMKIQQAGYLNVWTPRVQLLVGEPDHAPATPEQEDRLYARWLPALARDRSSNPNFSGVREGVFDYADLSLSWRPLSSCTSVPTIAAHPADQTSSGLHRIIQPFNAMRDMGLIQGAQFADLLSVVELERYAPDAIVLQRNVSGEHLEAMRRMKTFSRAFKVYDLDAYLPDLAASLPHSGQQPGDVLGSLRRALSFVDRLVVPGDFMAQLFEGFNADIRVVKNRLDPRNWDGLQGKRRCGEKPRVGWAGDLDSIAELEVVADVIKALADEVHWVFLGACPEHLRPFVHEFHKAVAVEQYPATLASLNLDLALAPLEDNLFNRCKSNVRLLEFGVCGVPVICSNLEAYRDGLPVKRVENRFENWVEAIRAHVDDLDSAAALGDYLQACVRHDWMLDGPALAAWHDSWLGR